MKKIVTIEGMSCGHCAMRVKKALEEVPGVTLATVELVNGKAEVEGDGLDANMLRGAVVKAGYQPVSILP
ncbi:MAG: copper chaperone [Spirochaetales bacterium]|nr:MAG: copper chaperone [Spirochaetales bacterium]